MKKNRKVESRMSTETLEEKVDGRRRPGTRTKILDAAEELFSRRGYYGVSLRDIAAKAGVQVALTHYHFGSKEDLFANVINRRADENVNDLEASLAVACKMTGSKEQRRRAIIRGFIGPIVDKSKRRGPGWKNYVRLLAQIANLPQEENFLSPYRLHFDEVVTDYVHALQKIHPEMDDGDVHWCFFFLQATLTHILVESGMIDRHSKGRFHSSDLDLIADKMEVFFSAGFSGFSSE